MLLGINIVGFSGQNLVDVQLVSLSEVVNLKSDTNVWYGK